jgi:hypothetical protein
MDRSSAALHLHLKLAELYLDMEKWVEDFYGSYYLEKAMVTESKAEQLSNLAEARNHLNLQCRQFFRRNPTECRNSYIPPDIYNL